MSLQKRGVEQAGTAIGPAHGRVNVQRMLGARLGDIVLGFDLQWKEPEHVLGQERFDLRILEADHTLAGISQLNAIRLARMQYLDR